jgi:ATP-dependent Clp protease ATP-binding subunit ClpC
VQEGIKQLRAGDPEAAVLLFQQALEADPHSLDAAMNLGHGFAAMRSWTRAADAYRKAIPTRPSAEGVASRAWQALGDALTECGVLWEAADALQTAATSDEKNAAAWMGLGRALRRLRAWEPALAAYRAAHQLRPEDLRPTRGMAACLDALGRHAEAVEVWQAALVLQPDSALALRGLAAAQEALAQQAPASPDVEIPRDEGMNRLAWASALDRDGRCDEALQVLDDALRRRPSLAAGWALRARILGNLQRWPEAATAWRSVVRFAEGDPIAHAGLASALVELGKETEALASYDQALALLGATSDGHAPAAEPSRADPPHRTAIIVARADLLRLLHRVPEALVELDRVLAQDPNHLNALVAKASALSAIGKYADALPLWRRVLRISPDHPAGLRGLKRAERMSESPVEAASPAAARTQGAGRIPFDLGKSYLQQGRFQEALAEFKRAANARKDWSEPLYMSGVAASRMGDQPSALAFLGEALRLDPTHVDAACHKGDIHRVEGAHAAALAAYEGALAHAPDLVHALGGRAETLRMLGRKAEAHTAFEHVLRLDPKDFVGLCGLAALLTQEQRFPEAKGLWERARALRPRHPFVLRGLQQVERGAAGEVVRSDITAEAVPPAPVTTSEDRAARARQLATDELDRGRSYYKERNFAAAIQSFRKALELDPTFAEAGLRLGMAYEDDRQFRRAVQAYETCLEVEPNHFQAATNIGESHRKNEQYLDAIQAYDRAIAIRPDYLYALAGRAECLRMLGKWDEALVWFDRALALGDNHAFAIQGKAATLNALQRFRDALVWWNKALELEPTSPFAQDGKAYCEGQLRRTGPRDAEPELSPPPQDADDQGNQSADDTASGTPTLDEQGRDLTAAARDGRLPAVIGREMEIRAVMKTLIRRLKGNPLLLGEPGVGKTAVVEGVARRLVGDDAPERLRGLRIIELSMGSLVAGTKYRGTFEERLKDIVREAKRTPGIVLFVDEIHTLVGAGRTEGGSLDAANILKPALARGEITVIGATTWAEYRKHFESDSALERRFQPIDIKEPSEEECLELLTRVQRTYEEHHGVRIARSALEACVRMSVRYVTDRRLPDKALDMLDEACADAGLSGEAQVDGDTVARVVSERTGVPARQLSEEDRVRIQGVEDALSQRVLGQPNAISALATAVRLARSGLRAPNRPRGVFLFRGASGVGKTEMAKSLADFLFPEGDALVRLDMSEYADKFTISRLLGAPPGYSGHGEEGQLTGPLRRRPYSVVLLDEFEKAHPEVQAVFLALLDEGRVTDAEGREVNAREAWFILTTNAGQEQKGKGRVGFGGVSGAFQDRERVLEGLKDWFRPELLNRLDGVIEFERLGVEALERVVGHRLDDLAARAAAAGLRLTWADDVPRHIAKLSADRDDGARPAIRAVDVLVGEPLGRVLLGSGERVRGWRAIVVGGEIRVEAEQEAQTASPPPTPPPLPPSLPGRSSRGASRSP